MTTNKRVIEEIYRFFERRYGMSFERNALTHIDINGDFKIRNLATAISEVYEGEYTCPYAPKGKTFDTASLGQDFCINQIDRLKEETLKLEMEVNIWRNGIFAKEIKDLKAKLSQVDKRVEECFGEDNFDYQKDT